MTPTAADIYASAHESLDHPETCTSLINIEPDLDHEPDRDHEDRDHDRVHERDHDPDPERDHDHARDRDRDHTRDPDNHTRDPDNDRDRDLYLFFKPRVT